MSATPTIVIDTGHSVREARRQSTYDGHPPKYSMTVCPHCHRYCAQLRGDWSHVNGDWSESLTCQCGHEYTRPLLPIEAERARRGQRRA